MDLTSVFISNLNGGQLQRIAKEIITRKHKRFTIVSSVGGVEGTERTRAGIPDLLFETDQGEAVYIEVTNDNKKKKVISDVTNCIEDLSDERNPIIISFLGFDPKPEVLSECKKLCERRNIRYLYYTNSMITEILNNEFPELKTIFVENIENCNHLHIDLFEDNYTKRIKYILENMHWLDFEQHEDVFLLVYELIDNAILHGKADKIYINLTESTIQLVDDGQNFSMESLDGCMGGGSYTFDYFKSKYVGKLVVSQKYVDGENITTIASVNQDKILLKTDVNCIIEIPNRILGRKMAYKKVMEVEIDDECDPIYINMRVRILPLSAIYGVLEAVERITKDRNIVLLVPHNRRDFVENFLNQTALQLRVKIICVKHEN